MLTPFGKYVRQQRIELGMKLKELADCLDVSSSYVSAIETGKKPIPEGYPEKVADCLRLDIADRPMLLSKASQSRKSFTVELNNHAVAEHFMVGDMLARKFHELSEEQLKEIQVILERGKRGSEP